MKYRLLSIGLVISLVVTTAFTGPKDKYFEIAKNMEIFSSIYKELNAYYVDDLDPNTLMRTGIDAMMNSLDPYTVYYSESQVESYRLNTDNKYNGLGAGSMEIDGKEVITEVFLDGPAYESGLQIGDVITGISGFSTEGRSHEDILQFLRGFPGTTLNMTIQRPSTGKTESFAITRSEVDIPNVPYSGMLNDKIGYVVLTTFTRDAGNNIADAVREMRKDNELEGLVIDLRNNGGGLLGEAVNILGIFLPKESPVVFTKGKVRERDITYSTRRTPIDLELPLVVLTNKSSASASEIVSGSIQDFDRGVVMGQRTYGKGLVQNHREVGYNSRIKLTTAKYYIPSGRCIQSVEYENGEPVDIQDNKRETFFTAGGRPVLDGGGVTPDVKLEAIETPEILEALHKEHWIFKYVNDYVSKNKEAPEVESFAFNGYDDFLGFLEKENFNFESSAEEKLSDLLEDADNYIQNDIVTLKNKIASGHLDDLTEFKDQIVRDLEIEIIKRYHFQKGKAQQNLKSDPEIQEAITLLQDTERYHKILSK